MSGTGKARAMRPLEFFFDFASPYAYLAHCRLPGIADRFGLEIVYRPISLFAARQAAGNTGPSSPQIPAKFRYIREDILRWADRYGVPFVFPRTDPAQPGGIRKEQIDSTRAHHAMFHAIRQGQARAFARSLWSRTYAVGGFIGEDANLQAACSELGWRAADLFAFIESREAADLYAACQQDAHARGVFGVPTMLLDKEMWWGNDRLPLLEGHLEAEAVHGKGDRQ